MGKNHSKRKAFTTYAKWESIYAKQHYRKMQEERARKKNSHRKQSVDQE